MRRLWGIAGGLLVLNAILFALGWGRGPRAQHGGPVAAASDGGVDAAPGIRIGLVFDLGGIGDKSFNDSAYRGLQRAARELGARVEMREPAGGADRDAYMTRFADEGVELVIGVGFIFSDDITRLARAKPTTKFACIDYAPRVGPAGELLASDGKPFPDNLVALTFREEEGSMLVGALAGLRAARGSAVVGFVGGMKIPLIEKFEAGFTAGVYRTCPRCKVVSAYAGSEPKAFADPTMGRELAMAELRQGAEVIFHASGKTGEGVFRAVTDAGKLAIGVDSDQADEAPGHVLTSMVKGVDQAVFLIAKDTQAGAFRGGVRQLGLAERGVSWVDDDKNRGLIEAGDRAAVEALRADIIAARVKAPARMADVVQP